MSSGPVDNPFDLSDTIVANATAAGRGALAVIRLSGRRAHDIAREAVEPWPTHPRTATLARVLDAEGHLLDRSIVVRYDAPASFTGDDSVEIVAHGGQLVPATIVGALIARGARLARPVAPARARRPPARRLRRHRAIVRRAVLPRAPGGHRRPPRPGPAAVGRLGAAAPRLPGDTIATGRTRGTEPDRSRSIL